MARISGIDLPAHKRIDIALTKIYGIGRNNVKVVLKKAGVEGALRVSALKEEQVGLIQKAIESTVKVEGDLRQEVQENIRRLRQIGSYRGSRHAHNLPSRGQRTRSNARTKRGKRVTIGAMRKETRAKMEKPGEQPAK